MKTFAINTVGCKVNQYESQQIRQLLERLGLNQVETSNNTPDLVVINTCCVTRTASAKSRQRIRKAQKLSPDAATVVCGCLPTVQTGELNNLGKNIHLISHRETIAATLSQIVNNGKAAAFLQPEQNIIIKAENGSKIKLKNKSAELPQLTSFKGHTRAFLKIQDGCDGYCSYCIIPKARPYVHSKPAEMVIQEAQALVEAGHKEIVVTGIFVGAYGQKSVRRKNWDGRQGRLADLLDKMAEIPDLARIRVSSLEPGDVTPRLLDTFCKHRNIVPHLHLSLQSGSNAVLKKMCRQYNADEFKEKIELIKSRLDRPAITADIIVGFPGEREADFEATVELAKEAGFAKMHVFSFSKRAGTAAAGLQGAVNDKVMKERSRILRDLDAELGHKFRQQFISETAEILVENSIGQRKGRSERYFMVYLEEKPGETPQKGELARVKLIKNTANGLIGQICEF
ncbi:MAG: tRNA (N(6)-L-threonylcarbamoyladenosine(37)-C(2))-methylthiotransferase MtaB [Sedimentisphaerales bacterium]